MYHCTIKKFSRGQGQSATAAAAYRAGAEIEDARTGEVHDYTRKSGVVSSHIVLPDKHPEWATDRSKLWSAAELAEKRKNSVVAREAELALPAELSESEREKLATDFAGHLVDKYRVAAEVCVHRPSRQGDQRNHHAHVLFTTRRMDQSGFTEKTRELDDKVEGPQQIESIRKDWEVFQNRFLERAGNEKRVDCRSLAAQREEALERAEDYEERAVAVGAKAEKSWRAVRRDQLSEAAQDLRVQAMAYRESAANLDREPGQHLGPARTAMQRRALRHLDQLRERLGKKVEQFQEAFQSRIQSMRESLEKLSGRLFQQEQRMTLNERVEHRNEIVQTSAERVRQGDLDETKLWDRFDVKSQQDLQRLDDDRFADFRDRHEDITEQLEVLDEISRKDAEKTVRSELDRYKQEAADRLEQLRQSKEREVTKSGAEERSVADRLREIRDAEREQENDQKPRDRGRDDPDVGL